MSIEPNSNLAIEGNPEQGDNRLLTGSEREAIKLAIAWSKDLDTGTQLPFRLFRAMLSLTLDRGERSVKLLPLDIVEEMDKEKSTNWRHLQETDELRKRIGQNFEKLVFLYSVKRDSLIERLTDQHRPHDIKLVRDISRGGVGNYTYYCLQITDLADQDRPVSVQMTGDGTTIIYSTLDITGLTWLSKLLNAGIELTGTARYAFAWLVTFAIASAISLLPLLIALSLTHPYSLETSLLALAFVGTAYLAVMLINLVRMRIIVAPFWLHTEQAGLVLQLNRDNSGESRLSLVRYVGVCPACQGKVTIRSGGIRFYGRLVGACEHSPREHAFSFDHRTRLGKRFE